jgi:hypothetical protein
VTTDLLFIATTVQFQPAQPIHDAFTVSPPDLSSPTLTCSLHSLQNRLSYLLLSSLKHGPLSPCRPFPMLFKLGQSEECSLHTPRSYLAISRLSISIPRRSAPFSSFFHHHHKHNILTQTIKSNQLLAPLQIHFYHPPPTNQSIWVHPQSPVSVKARRPTSLTVPAALFRRPTSPTVPAASFRRTSPTARDAWLCN